MHGFFKLAIIEFKLFLREPQALFFTLAFPLMMLFIFGTIYGNEPTPFFGGFGSVDVSVPAYTAVIIATSGLMGLTISVTSYREQGILRRFRLTPLNPISILAAEIFIIFLMTAIGMLLLILAGKIVYGLRCAGNPVYIFGGFWLSCLSFFCLGFVLASIFPTMRTAQTVSMAIYFPMIFLTGATIPREVLPSAIQEVGQLLPLTHVVNLLRGLWIGQSWSNFAKEIFVLIGMVFIGICLSVKAFRWE